MTGASARASVGAAPRLAPLVALLVIIPAVILAGCLGGTPPPDNPKEGPIKIGIILPYTGQISFVATSMERGYDLAVDQINSRGGIDGRKVVLLKEDDKLDATIAIQAMKKLAGDKVPIVIGSVASGTTIPLVPIAEQNSIVLLSAASTNDRLSGSSPYFFRNIPSDGIQGPESAKIASEKLGAKKVAIVYQNNDYGVGLKNLFSEAFKAKGGTIVASEGFEGGDVSFSTQVATAIAGGPELIYLPGYPLEQARIIKEARTQGFTGKFLASEAFGGDQVFQVGGDAVEGTYVMKPAVVPGRTVYSQFATAYKNKYGVEPEFFSDYAYDAVIIAVEAIDKAGYEGPKIQAHLAATDTKFTTTVTREVQFDAEGDVVGGTYSLFIAKNEAFEPVK